MHRKIVNANGTGFHRGLLTEKSGYIELLYIGATVSSLWMRRRNELHRDEEIPVVEETRRRPNF
jgi:hypothetical protein